MRHFISIIFLAISILSCKKDHISPPLGDLPGTLLLAGTSIQLVPGNKDSTITELNTGLFNNKTYRLIDVSPDMTRALFSRISQLVLTDWTGNVLKTFNLEEGHDYTQFKLSPDSRRVAAIKDGKRVAILDLETSKTKHEFEPESVIFAPIESVDGLCWSPDGNSLALLERYIWGIFTDHDIESLNVITVDTLGKNKVVVFDGAGCSGTNLFGCQNSWKLAQVAWSPDGSSLAWYSSHESGELWVGDAFKENSGSMIFSGIPYILALHWSPDNNFLAFQRSGGTYVFDRVGRQSYPFQANTRPIFWFE